MVDNTSVWGRKTAKERYGTGGPSKIEPKFEDRSFPQKAGDIQNLQGPDFLDDHPDDWVRGKGESAEGKPSFRESQGYTGKK